MPRPADRIRVLASAQGFALFGVAEVAPSMRTAEMAQWIIEGKHGEMGYLAEHLALRQDPRALLEGAKSVLVVADAYANEPRAQPSRLVGIKEEIPLRVPQSEPRGNAQPNDAHPPSLRSGLVQGRFARYAFGKDYHDTLKKRLHAMANQLRLEFPAAQFRVTVDTAPIHEREVALRAGLGWIGKNTLLLHPRHGSYFLLGTLITTLDLEPSQKIEPDHCANCRKCIEACPTQAIAPEGYSLDARRCISYLTLEHRSPIAPALFAGMGDWLGGCDICQEVCPYNKVAEKTPLPVGLGHKPRAQVKDGAALLDVLNWTEDDRRRVFQTSALKRMKLEMVQRNALIAAGNALKKRDLPQLRLRVAQLAADGAAHPLVRETARAVMAAP